ncbi:MAG: hypothetical protein EZS28_052614, partial [Streblomastix strix]
PNNIFNGVAILKNCKRKDVAQVQFHQQTSIEQGLILDIELCKLCFAKPAAEQVVEARERARAATDLVTRRKPQKHNNPQAQPILAIDQVLADLKTKVLQQYRLQQRTVSQIVNEAGYQL